MLEERSQRSTALSGWGQASVSRESWPVDGRKNANRCGPKQGVSPGGTATGAGIEQHVRLVGGGGHDRGARNPWNRSSSSRGSSLVPTLSWMRNDLLPSCLCAPTAALCAAPSQVPVVVVAGSRRLIVSRPARVRCRSNLLLVVPSPFVVQLLPCTLFHSNPNQNIFLTLPCLPPTLACVYILSPPYALMPTTLTTTSPPYS